MIKQQPAGETRNNPKNQKKEVFKMTKKFNSIAKTITRTVLAAIMVASITAPALAAGAFAQGSNAADPATAAITKIFKIPVNTTTPEATFTFNISPIGVNGNDITTGMPALGTGGSVAISFAQGQTPTFVDGGTQYLVAQSADILGSLAKDGTAWAAGAGVYKYLVKEVRGSGIVHANNPDIQEFDHYSEAEYEIEIWVEEDEDGILFPMYIVAYYIAGTPDEYYPGTPGDGKIDPTPGTTVPGTPEDIGELYSQVIFTNRYWEINSPVVPTLEKNSLEITKQVTGNNPDFTAYYEFNVTVFTPDAVGAAGKTYNAYIVDKDGNYVALGANGNPNTASGTSSSPAAGYITFTSGAEGTVYLKHGDRLVFFDLEVGAEVQAFETIENNARVKYTRTFSTEGEFIMPVGTTGAWGFPRNPGDNGPHYTKEGVRANVATFINNMTGNPPTGVSVDNLPFIIMIGAAIAGLAAFVAVKARRKADHSA